MKDIKIYIDVILHYFEVGLASFFENLFPMLNFYPALRVEFGEFMNWKCKIVKIHIKKKQDLK
jgi:hypothetical protein